jgi:biopolymer transport protein ExbD
MKFKGGRELKPTKIEIIPMIDTMFFLLVFFILSSVGVIKLQGINVNLPKPSDSQQPNEQKETPLELTVAINAREEVSVNRIPVPQNGDVGTLLIQEITRQKGSGYNVEEATVVVTADPAASYGVVVQAIDQAKAQKLTRFAIATDAETPAPTQ